MTAVLRQHTANLITVSRVFLLIPWVICYRGGCGWMVPVMFAIILSDLIDGKIARLLETASPQGGILDAACDSIVVLVAMLVMGSVDPFCLGAAFIIVLSMFTWVFRCITENRFSYSRFGRYNGAVCYAFMSVAGFVSLSFSTHSWRITVLETAFFSLLIIQLGLSSLENISASLRVRSRSGFSF